MIENSSGRQETVEEKRVLVVSHVFWPVNLIGAMRPLHVVAELLERGYKPAVLALGHWDKTVNDCQYGAFVAEQTRIMRVHLFRPVLWLRALSDRLQCAGRVRLVARIRLVLRRAVETVIDLIDCPCCVIGVFLQGGWFCISRRPACIYCSVPPFRTLVGSALVATCLRVPLVADFRDLWTLNEYFERRCRSKLRAWVEHVAEQFVLRSATHVILNTDMAKTMMVDKYPEYAAKFSVVTNGILVDRDRVSARPGFDGPFTIVHIGSVYLDRDPSDFLEGLREWIKRRGEAAGARVVVKFVGRGSERVAEQMRSIGHNATIEALPQKTKSELCDVFAGAHLFLLCLGYRNSSKYVVPAKMYDYLAAGKPIIAYAPRDGEVVRLMSEIGLDDNVVTEPDLERTIDILDREFDRYLRRDGTFSVPPEVTSRYDYSVIARKIERVIARAATRL